MVRYHTTAKAAARHVGVGLTAFYLWQRAQGLALPRGRYLVITPAMTRATAHLSVDAAAKLIGRHYSAVKNARKRLAAGTDPRYGSAADS